MANKRYSNKGVNSQRNAQVAPMDKSSMYTAIICVALIVVIVVALIVAIAVTNNKGTGIDMAKIQSEINSKSASDFKETDKETDYVKITVKDYGDIVIRLRDDVAPETVENFKMLVSEGFYDGLKFHRIIEGFMMQGGYPDGDGSGGSPDTIKGEFASNGFENNLSHIPGVVSMARTNAPNSASSQFFIVNGSDAAHLDGEYAAFGYVVAGMDVVYAASSVEVNGDTPKVDVIMEKVCFVKK